MDADRFDAVARLWAAAGSRRAALTAVVGGAVGLLGLADPDQAAAARSGKCKPRCGECAHCRRGKCRKTKHGRKRCRRGRCQPLRFGTPCTMGICQNGSCIAAAPPSLCADGLTFCNGSCINTRTNDANCGGCGTVCPAERTCCDGVCRHLSTHDANCGVCGRTCAARETCCTGTCRNLTTDEANCGVCGRVCTGTQLCLAGICATPA
jgi:hypothetical protein